tara:strand:- start:186 stop:1487 length:1302 start_codon:yes stop_codon:yes gene_type:complete
VIFYFLKRSIREPNYRKNLGERLGFDNRVRTTKDPIWIHAVSLGEFRACVPLIRALLQRSEKVLLTTITPAGRNEAQKVFCSYINAKKIHLVYLPLEYDFAFYQFISRWRPRFVIILEYELWPVMISSCTKYKIPLVLAQGQYIEKSFLMDKKWPWFRGALFNSFDLILAKSYIHKARYKFFCNNSVEVMGELRFDQEISSDQIKSAEIFLKKTSLKKHSRLCFCFGSTGPGEDEILIALMKRLNTNAIERGMPKPFYIYVPRHEKSFLKICQDLKKSGLNIIKRSEMLDKNLKLHDQHIDINDKIDGILGDSLGEINFYFKISDYIFIGNSFNNLGSHNVIEPLALKKPVVVGPSVWGIEYPIVEAVEKGIIKIVETPDELYEHWWYKISRKDITPQNDQSLRSFYNSHSGATRRCIKKLEQYGFLSKNEIN